MCENCNTEYDIINGYNERFCTKKCSYSYSTKFDDKKETKESMCICCNINININKRTSHKTALCPSCQKKRSRISNIKDQIKNNKTSTKIFKGSKLYCKYCGQEKCSNSEVCKKFRIIPTLIKYFGFNENVIGTLDFYKEYYRIRTLIENEYYDNKLSTIDLCEKYDHDNDRNLGKIMSSLGIKRRTLSDAVKNTLITNKVLLLPSNNIFKHGWHTTWSNNKVYYRSSYELDYCLELDKEKVEYSMESIRIEYWDSQKNTYRIAIPDFYIPSNNTIVEIKSDWTYNKTNMLDRKQEYNKKGFNFKLILEHNEVEL